MNPEQKDQLNASTLAVAARVAKLTAERIMDGLPEEAAMAVFSRLENGARLEIRVAMSNPPEARMFVVGDEESVEIGAIVATLLKDRLQ